ncbi:MAG TPA: ImmA/IrrE family metallo-endopeptidase [Dehalococcoidia bacterium]|nr:ImmA/IrrE family metallo-endopeptidase [Dehalococcoidia bacterium]
MWGSGRREVEQLAESLTSKFGGPPVDLPAIASAVGIIDIAYCDMNSAALLQVGPVLGTWGVVIRRLDARARQRFSLAHEIAHVALGIVGDEWRYKGEAAARDIRAPAERLCDYYAAALLMPRWLVNKAAAETPDVNELARMFDVSGESMKIRLEHCGLHAIR